MAWLRQFPVHQIKIDRAFVRRATASHNATAIMQALINLAHNLGIEVKATCVDTDAQRNFMRAQCCDLAKGGPLSPPLWPQQVPWLVNETNRG